MNNQIIECPNCHAQYFACEIFLPNVFFGKPDKIVKDEHNKILSPKDCMNLKEEFSCDCCEKTFFVNTIIDFQVDEKKDLDFSKDYVTLLRKNDIFMDEE